MQKIQELMHNDIMADDDEWPPLMMSDEDLDEYWEYTKRRKEDKCSGLLSKHSS